MIFKGSFEGSIRASLKRIFKGSRGDLEGLFGFRVWVEFRALGCRRARIRATASIPVRAFSGRAGYYKVFLFFQGFMQVFYRLVQGLLRFAGCLSRISCRVSRRVCTRVLWRLCTGYL